MERQEIWIYEISNDNSARFILGTKGNNPLICIGVNPSTATPTELDPTLRKLRSVAEDSENEFDSFIMLNLYPQRSTIPDELHKQPNKQLIEKNKRVISKFINSQGFTIWVAWGGLIKKRKYLKICLKEIIELPELKNCRYVKRGPTLKAGHPHHPLYVKKDSKIEMFDINKYLKSI